MVIFSGTIDMLIRTRLTLQFLLIGGFIMITASTAIYFFTSEFRRDEFRSLLRGRAISTAKLVLDSYEFNANLLLRTRSDYPSRLTDEKIIILNNENDTLYISDRSWHFARTGAVISRVKSGKELYTREGDSEILGTSHANGIYKFIVIAAATDKDGRLFMKKLLTILILVCIVSLLLFSIAGWFYSGRALKPISDMVRKVGDISIASLNLRVPEGNEIDELALSMGITFPLKGDVNRIDLGLQYLKRGNLDTNSLSDTSLMLMLGFTGFDIISKAKDNTRPRDIPVKEELE